MLNESGTDRFKVFFYFDVLKYPLSGNCNTSATTFTFTRTHSRLPLNNWQELGFCVGSATEELQDAKVTRTVSPFPKADCVLLSPREVFQDTSFRPHPWPSELESSQMLQIVGIFKTLQAPPIQEEESLVFRNQHLTWSQTD